MEESRFIQLSLTLLLLSLVPWVTADDSVKVKLNSQTVTSSTLKWTVPNNGQVPENAVVGSLEYVLAEGITEQDLLQNISAKAAIRERKIYVCRAKVNSKPIPGALIEKSPGKFICVVALVTQVHQKEKYEVLQNVDKAARLIWENWEKSIDVPNGAILSGEYYISHSTSLSFKMLPNDVNLGMLYLMGKIEQNLGIFGKMSVVTENNEVIQDVSNGQVLVEKEPIMYELTLRKLITNRMKVNWRNTTVLGETTLRNDDPNEMKAEAVITYAWKYISSWGFGRAMLKGLTTTIFLLNSSSVENITWGLPFEEERNGIEKVESMLPTGTASHVQVIGDYLEIEVPYKAVLLSVFNDSTMMNRTVEWTWRYTTLMDVRTIYGPLYYIHNNTLVPTTTTTTTESPPTTTPSTTTMTNEIIKTTINQTSKNDDKKTTSGVKEDMQNDQNNALELNKGDESERTGSGSRCFSHSSFIVNTLLISLVFGYISNTIT